MCALAILVSLSTQFAQAQMAIGIKAGSTGFGGEVTRSMSEKFNVRISGTFFNYQTNGVYADQEPSIAYDVEGAMTSIGIIADFFPARRGFKLSAGLFYHDFLIDGGASPNEDYEFNDQKTFSRDKLGSLTGSVDYESKLVPYAGIGVGNPVAPGSKIKLNFNIGAMYTNSPRVTMEGEGLIGPTANQGQDFEDGMQDFKFYPVINLGLSFRLQ
ncbi:MAG: hypothetical protein CL670_11795 [Balneola sp.]|jgi:hypothetical protein|nr:hypothetical protein [Balneola sp.]MBE79830.1 hypothetical protein [Balneola sp.]|tara:strand:+ start:95 stop:736 length:642 start_codon:yes stop_codon:yes gene_type:complete